MKKRNRLIYWIATIWLSLGMLSTGIVQLLAIDSEVEFILKLGYPAYFVTLIGICKIAGVLVVLMPKLSLLKEWAYAGFFFLMAGALCSHLAAGSGAKDALPSLLLLTLTLVSWYFRPADRRIVAGISNRK